MGLASSLRTLYNCNPPAKRIAYVFLFLGNSMVNGYATDYHQLSENNYNTYMPDNEWPWWILGSYGGIVRGHYTRTTYTGMTITTGNHIYAMMELYNSDRFSDGDLFCFCHSENGTSIINGEAGPWSTSASTGPLVNAKRKMDWDFSYLEKLGYTIKIVGINFSIGAVGPDSVYDHYLAEYQALISNIRTYYVRYFADTAPWVIGIIPGANWAPSGDPARAAIINVSQNDPLVEIFDIANYPPQANDAWHQRTQGVVAFGQFVSSGFIKLKFGGTYPTATNGSIVSDLKVTTPVTATYTYSGEGNEGSSKITITYANDAIGTGEIYIGQHFKGSSTLLTNPTHVGKYIRARIEPVSLTGIKFGKAILTPFVGPITL